MWLQALTHLNLSSCKLEAAPLELPTLVSLEYLDLSNNLLYDVPATLHTLSRLRCLRLERNRLHVLPAVLTHLTLLSELCLTGNEIIYSEIAPRVASLPHLCSFTFPTPFESFSWSTVEVRVDTVESLCMCGHHPVAIALRGFPGWCPPSGPPARNYPP